MRNLAILPVLVLLAAGCGLPTEPYLYPPISMTNPLNPGVLLFENPTGNDPDVFSGFLLFYKIYNSGDPALSGDLQVTGESFFTSYRLNSYSISQERGVNDRYTLFEAFTVPFGERNDDFQVLINFSDVDNTFGKYPADAPTPTFTTFYRKFRAQEASENDWTIIKFSRNSNDYDIGDSDLPAGFEASPSLVCAVWAVAYGFDIFDSFQNVYSEAEYIGQFTYTIF